MVIDYINESDLERIAVINLECNLDNVSPEYLSKHIFDSSYNSIFIKCVIDKEIVGYAGVIYVTGEKYAEIEDIAVIPKYRRIGIGEKLLERIVNEAITKGIKEIFLEVRKGNTSAVYLYRKHGFIETGIRKNYYKNPTEDALVMKKVL